MVRQLYCQTSSSKRTVNVIAVIVNEFGELDIDADLLRSCPIDCDDDTEATALNVIPEDGIYELANGCICCTVEEEFLPVNETASRSPW